MTIVACVGFSRAYLDLQVGPGQWTDEVGVVIYAGPRYEQLIYWSIISDMHYFNPVENFDERIYGVNCGEPFVVILGDTYGDGLNGHPMRLCKRDRNMGGEIKIITKLDRNCGGYETTYNYPAVSIDPCKCDACPAMCGKGWAHSDDCPQVPDDAWGIPRAQLNFLDEDGGNYWFNWICTCLKNMYGSAMSNEENFSENFVHETGGYFKTMAAFKFNGGGYACEKCWESKMILDESLNGKGDRFWNTETVECRDTPCQEDDFIGCIYSFIHEGGDSGDVVTCDDAFDKGFTCEQLESPDFGWNCAGCACLGDRHWVDITDTEEYRVEACDHFTTMWHNDSSHWCTTVTLPPLFNNNDGFLNLSSGAFVFQSSRGMVMLAVMVCLAYFW